MQGTQPCNWRVTRGLFQARGFATGISSALVFLLVRVGKKESGQNSPGRVPSSMQVPAARERGSVCCCISGRVRVATLRCRSVLYFFRILKSFVACLHCMKSKTQFRGPSRGRFPSTFLLPQDSSLATSLFSSAHATPARPAVIVADSHLRSVPPPSSAAQRDRSPIQAHPWKFHCFFCLRGNEALADPGR